MSHVVIFRAAKNPPTYANRFEGAFLSVVIRIRGIAGGSGVKSAPPFRSRRMGHPKLRGARCKNGPLARQRVTEAFMKNHTRFVQWICAGVLAIAFAPGASGQTKTGKHVKVPAEARQAGGRKQPREDRSGGLRIDLRRSGSAAAVGARLRPVRPARPILSRGERSQKRRTEHSPLPRFRNLQTKWMRAW